jgi:hypothetical protein
VHNHDGFYLRLSAGLGYGSDSIKSHVVNSASFKGGAATTEIYVGGTPTDGLVVGGAAIAPSFGSPSTEVNGKSVGGPKQLALAAFGPFVDWYFDPHRGFHAQAFLGIASLRANDSSPSQDPTGFAAALGVGNEWWIGEQWSLGVLASVLFSSMSYDTSGIDETHSFVIPTVQATLTYH